MHGTWLVMRGFALALALLVAAPATAQQATPQGTLSDLSEMFMQSRGGSTSARTGAIDTGLSRLFAMDQVMARITRSYSGAMPAGQRQTYGDNMRYIVAYQLADATRNAQGVRFIPQGEPRLLSANELALAFKIEGSDLPDEFARGAAIMTPGRDGLYRVLDIEFAGTLLISEQEKVFNELMTAAMGDTGLALQVTVETANELRASLN